MLKHPRFVCLGEVPSKGLGALEKDIADLRAAMADLGLERAS